MNEIKTKERIDDLQIKGFKLIQDPDLFCFGIDAVLLSDFVLSEKNNKVLDMCTGNGIIPLLLYAKEKATVIDAIEIQSKSADIARRNMILNNIQDTVKVVEGDVKEASAIFGKEKYDVVTCNPPYMIKSGGLVNPNSAKAVARHEILCEFEDIAREAGKVLKTGGRLYLIHRPRRLTELFESLKRNRLEPKKMQMVHSYADKEAAMVLIEAVKDGGVELIIKPPHIIYDK